MKYIKNVIFVSALALTLVFVGCDAIDDSRFGVNPEQGWVQFNQTNVTANASADVLSIPVAINVPIFKNGIEIGYEVSPVEGDYTQFVTVDSGLSVFESPVESNKVANIDFALNDLDMVFETTSFEVTLTSTNIDGVSVGVDENTPTTILVTIPCSNPTVIPDDYFVGDYTIADVAATIGPGNGTENFAAGTVTLVPGPGNTRVFSSAVLPAFNGEIETVTITFTTNNVVTLGDVDPGLACSAAGPYVFTAATDTADEIVNTPWDICDDSAITVVYTEDPNGSCGGPFLSSFSLVKN